MGQIMRFLNFGTLGKKLPIKQPESINQTNWDYFATLI